METLPNEILTEIFSFLNTNELLSVSEVCKYFFSVINSHLFLRKICGNITESQNFEYSSRHYVNLKVHHATDEHLKKCVTLMKKSTTLSSTSTNHLKFDDVEMSDAALLSNLLVNFVNIREIHLEGIYLKQIPSECRPISLMNLTTVKFFYSSNQLLNLFTKIKGQLFIFKVCLLPHKDDNEKRETFCLVENILRNNRTTIKKLNFYEVNFDDQFLSQISSIDFFHLSKLSMSFNSYLEPESKGFEKFITKNSKTLEKYKIRTFDHIKQHQLKVLFNEAVNIRFLNLIICSHCDYEIFSGIKNLKKLESLKIQPTNYCSVGSSCYIKFIKDKILSHPNELMKNLSIEMFPASDEIIQTIILSFPNLRTLRLSADTEVIQKHFDLLKNKLERLEKITFND